MITEQNLINAIAECKGVRNPDSSTCIKLAAFYTIYDHLYPSTETKEVVTSKIEPTIGDYGNSEFLQAVKGKKADVIWEIMDELVDTVQLINPKLYDGLMRQLM